MMHHKSFDLDLKADDATGGFTAYMARFGNIDRAAEIIQPGAFKNLPAFQVDGWVGVNHDMAALPVAIVESAEQDANGLLVRAKWHSTPEAQACRAVVTERLKAGKSVKCSIGYRVLDSFKDSVDGRPVTRLTALDLFEASIVNLPANPAADVLSAKSEGPPMEKVITVDALKGWLDAQFKAGRVLSRANHGKLKEMHGALSATCAQLKELIDVHDPDNDAQDEPDDDGDEKARAIAPPKPKGARPTSAGDGAESAADQLTAGKSLTKLRAASLRARLALLRPSATEV